jgi:hypothetical protein
MGFLDTSVRFVNPATSIDAPMMQLARTRLQHQPAPTLTQLIGVLPRGCHDWSISHLRGPVALATLDHQNDGFVEPPHRWQRRWALKRPMCGGLPRGARWRVAARTSDRRFCRSGPARGPTDDCDLAGEGQTPESSHSHAGTKPPLEGVTGTEVVRVAADEHEAGARGDGQRPGDHAGADADGGRSETFTGPVSLAPPA